MNILFLTRRFWPEIGGVEKHCLEVGKRLVESGHEVVVVTETHSNLKFEILNFKSISKYKNIKINRIPITLGEKQKKFQIWKWLWKNRNLIKEADIVHCHDVFYWYLPFRFLYPKKKVFVTFHGYEGNLPPNKRKIFMHRLAAKLTDGSIAIGDWHEKWYGVKADAVSYGAVGKGSLDRLGMTEKLNGILRGKTPQNDNTYDFCFVGRLAKDTGIMVYLETVRILKEKGTSRQARSINQKARRINQNARSISLVVCGDGPLFEEAKRFSEDNKLEVKFEGFVEEVGRFVSQSKFVFVSRYLGILESLVAKKLIFAVYDSPIKEDYLRMAPFAPMIIIENNPEKLAEKVEYFIDHQKEADELIKKGYNWARNQSWEKMTDAYLKLWRE